jgi:hypothetical protein
VVDNNGQPIALKIGDFVRISEGRGTDVNGDPLTAGFYMVEDGSFKRKDEGDYVVVTRDNAVFKADGKRLDPGTYRVFADGNFLLEEKGTFIIGWEGASVIGSDGEKMPLAAGEAYRVGADGQTPERLAPGTVFADVDWAGGEKCSYVVGADGKPKGLFGGEFVQISRDGSTDLDGNPLKPGFYKVEGKKFVPQEKGYRVVITERARVLDDKGKRLSAGKAYIVGDGGSLKQESSPEELGESNPEDGGPKT